jgi:hypothetical protein
LTLVGPLGIPWWVPLVAFVAMAGLMAGMQRLRPRMPRSTAVLDSTALLIGLAVVGLFPIGPSLGAATVVLILGTNGVAAEAAAGTLLTATAAAGALCFASWAVVDRLWMRPEPAAAPKFPFPAA